jgi:uncharacterized membrane protein
MMTQQLFTNAFLVALTFIALVYTIRQSQKENDSTLLFACAGAVIIAAIFMVLTSSLPQ